MAGASTNAFGATSVGSLLKPFVANRRVLDRYRLSAAGSITELTVYLQPTSTGGQQMLRGVIYADSSGSPGRMLALSRQLVFHHAEAAGWYQLTLAAPVSVGSGAYWIGVIPGASSSVAAYRHDGHRISLYASYTPRVLGAPAPPLATTAHASPVQSAPAPIATATATVSSSPSSSAPPTVTTNNTTTVPTVTATENASAGPVHCDLIAAPAGSDSTGNGSLASPYRTVVKLDAALSPGQTGCLRAGSYGSTSTLHRIATDGTSGERITITSYPGEQATVIGWVDIEASYTTVSHLQIDGSNTFYDYQRDGTNCPYPVSQGLVIAGHDDIFEHNDYYQSVASLRGNGIGIGWWGQPDNTIIRFNKIHDVGQCLQYDHLIYLSHGNNVQIYGNWMWNDPHGNGVTIYPAPTNARIFSNVIDGAGTGLDFGDEGDPTAGNRAWNNVITNSTGIHSQGFTLAPVMVRSPGLGNGSVANAVYDNDSWGNAGGVSELASSVTSSQLSVTGTISVDPRFIDAANHNYNVQTSSPIAGWGLWNGI